MSERWWWRDRSGACSDPAPDGMPTFETPHEAAEWALTDLDSRLKRGREAYAAACKAWEERQRQVDAERDMARSTLRRERRWMWTICLDGYEVAEVIVVAGRIEAVVAGGAVYGDPWRKTYATRAEAVDALVALRQAEADASAERVRKALAMKEGT